MRPPWVSWPRACWSAPAPLRWCPPVAIEVAAFSAGRTWMKQQLKEVKLMKLTWERCPFCGGCGMYWAFEEVRHDSYEADDGSTWHYIQCLQCGATGPLAENEDEAVEGWNRREPPKTAQ